MNKWLVAGTGLALTLGGVAVAQTAPPPGPPAGMEGRPQMGGPQEGGPDEGGRHGRHGGWMGMRGHRPPPPIGKAAFFRFHKGDASVAIKCPDDEPVKACVDAATALMDKLAQQK